MERRSIEVAIHTQILFWKCNVFPKSWSTIANAVLTAFLHVNGKAFTFMSEIIKQDRRWMYKHNAEALSRKHFPEEKQ